jgi:hypothetical protein
MMNACVRTLPCEETETCTPRGTGGDAGAGAAGAEQGGKSGSAGTSAGGKGGTSTGGKGGASGGSGKGGASGGAGKGRTGGESGSGGEGGASGESSQSGGMGGGSGSGGAGVSGGTSGTAGASGGIAGTAGAGNPEPECGNGQVEGDEQCDDGEDNGLGLDRCAPDCSRVIQAKRIVLLDPALDDELLAPNPVATADSYCPSGYKALFAHGSERRATTVPFKNVSPIDWVLTPYTFYVNAVDNLVWLTRDVALLGVEGGAFVGLANPIGQITHVVVSNLNIDGTMLVTDNCNGWTSPYSMFDKHYGFPLSTDETFLKDTSPNDCGYDVSLYCVEQ